LAITHHGRLEIANAIGRAVFLGFLDGLGGDKAFGNFALDLTEGRLVQAEILWRAALNRGVELSRKYSPRMGTRFADVLHVACALELKLRHFLTFDERQKDLAIAVGLKAVNPLI
jgi:predicted nucleic acid-binding protein